jgi:hypothetical protein
MIKKLTFLILFMTLVLSFSFAGNVSPETARKAGIRFYSERVSLYKTADLPGIAVSESFTEKRNGEPVYYVFNFTDKGFIIVSADDAVTPVLAYSYDGTYSLQDPPPQFVSWMEGYAKQIEYARINGMAAGEEAALAWKRLLSENGPDPTPELPSTDVAPLLISTWDQGAGYNALCPADPAGPDGHVWAGCVATAMAQVMYYYRYPETGMGSHCYTPWGYSEQCADFGATTYRWNEMLNSASYPDTAMAELIWHCGVAVDMMYSPSGSGAYSNDAAYALRNYFKYSPDLQLLSKDSYSEEEWKAILMDNLDNKHPMYYHGFGSGGHAFNVDGYQGTDYFHFNWGWSGYYNGYYYLDNLNPGGNNFTNGQGAIVNFYPDNVNYTYPPMCTGQHVLTALYGTLEDGSGPDDYADNANCSWLLAPEGISDSITAIILTFNKFSTEEGNDIVNIYAGSSTTDNLVASFSGSTLPPSVTVPGNKALVTFSSNGNTTSSGWFITYVAQSMKWCSGMTTIIADTAVVSDGSFDFNYRNNSGCRWKLETASGNPLTVNFRYFDTEPENDFLMMVDPVSQEILARLSGHYSSQNPPAPVTSPSGKMLLIFNTNDNTTGEGWEIYYPKTTTGIGEKENVNDLVLYPNPADVIVNIEAWIGTSQDARLELIGMDGKRILSEPFAGNAGILKKTLDVSGIPGGIYLLRVISGDGVATRKLVIE